MRKLWDVSYALAVALVLLPGCVTQSYAPNTDTGALELKIKAGDAIRVVTTRRERVSFKVTEIRGDRFVGVTTRPHKKEPRPAGESVEVPYQELAMLQVTRLDKHSVALVAALVTVSAFAVVTGPVTVVPLAVPAAP